MSGRKPKFCLSLLIAVFCAALASAQVPAPLPPDPPDDAPSDSVVELNSDLVLVTAVVSKGGDGNKLVRNLRPGDFTVLDDGVPQPLAFFGDESIPLDVVFLVDASQSVRIRQQFQREALGAFLRTLLRPGDRAAVLWFNNTVHVEQDFTSDPGALLGAMNRIPSGGATSLYQAIAAASDRLATCRGRRAVVVLSDGRDTFSDLRLENALECAQRADAVVYGVNTSFARWAVTPEFRRNDPLEYLATETGGEVYYTAQANDVEDALSRLSGRLRERYTLGFYPSASGQKGRYHRITVKVGQKNARVDARSGYYAR